MRYLNTYAALFLGAASLSLLPAGPAAASSHKMTLYCSPQIEWCQLVIKEFEKETGIKVAMTRKSSGETFAQINAERKNPKGDVWWGGTGDPHLQAAEEGLTVEYKSPMLSKLRPWAQTQAKQANYKTVGSHLAALGFGYHTVLPATQEVTGSIPVSPIHVSCCTKTGYGTHDLPTSTRNRSKSSFGV